MPLTRVDLPLSAPQLPYLAKWLLAHPCGEPPLGLADALVLLPAARPCATLTHALLEAGGTDALVLPWITTPDRLARQVAACCGLDDADQLPAQDIRSLLLARRMVATSWSGHEPEAVPSLAEELVALFDTVRLHQLEELLRGEGELEPWLALENPAAVELLGGDIEQVRAAWQLYRTAVPQDETDLLVAVAHRLEQAGWPGRQPPQVVIAGFADISPVVASILRSVGRGSDTYLFQASAADRLSGLILATYRDPALPSHPLQPAARAAASIVSGGKPGDGAAASAGSDVNAVNGGFSVASHLSERLSGLGDAVEPLGAAGPVTLVPCDDPEHESREVVRRVVKRLAAGPSTGPSPARICIATADRELAARVVARLRDAGIDTDDTGGQPLSGQPAGILARAILRSVVTGRMFDQLLELLTHPWVDLRPAGRRHHEWTLRLEKRIRANLAAVAGRQALRQLAREYDRHAKLGGMTAFVGQIDTALEPLEKLHDRRRHGWRDYLAAFRTAWSHLAPGYPLSPESAENEPSRDLAALAQLMADLAAQAERPGALPTAVLSDFAADFARLLVDRSVRNRRSAFLPVQVMGLIEARLEHFDLLVLAGMREDVLPGRRRRPLWFSDRFCAAVGLPTWRERDARDAELFMRLLHNGDEVVVSWPAEAGGRPVLPSPQVTRLLLVRDQPSPPDTDTIYRVDPADPAAIAARQAAFAAESPQIPGYAARPVRRLSYSALSSHHDCPYRFLLERGYELREEEQVLRQFQSRDFGNLVHACLAEWLAPAGAGWRALASGDSVAAASELARIADRRFGSGSAELPIRRLWEIAFARAHPALAEWETERFRRWRPLLREVAFALPLEQLATWLKQEAERQAVPLSLPPVDPAAGALTLGGVIDRVDAEAAGSTEGAARPQRLAVIDYKTGALPTVKSIREGEEQQVTLYALAVEAGGVAELAERSADAGFVVVAGAYYKVDAVNVGFARPQLDFQTAAGRANLLAAGRSLLAGALAASRGEGPFPLVPAFTAESAQYRFPCRHCALRGVCRIEERIDTADSAINPQTAAALRKMLATQKVL